MKLWLLTRDDRCGYDENNGFVIRAEDETAARTMAAAVKGGEGEGTWLLRAFSTCSELSADGTAQIVLTDFNAG